MWVNNIIKKYLSAAEMLWNTSLVFQLEENMVMWQYDFFFFYHIVQPQYKISLH